MYLGRLIERNGLKLQSLPVACCINFESASIDTDSDLSPVQSKQCEDSQSVCAQDLLQPC